MGMPQAILSRIPDSPNFEDGIKNQMQIEEYKVDCVSLSSNQDPYENDDDEEDDFNTENAIVCKELPNQSTFGSVSVVNSNDVHFGNKTVYKGPVTIKQFVYPNGDVNNDSLSGLVKTIGFNPNNGEVNDGFDKDPNDIEYAEKYRENQSEEEGEQETNVIGRRISKGFKWIKTVPCKKPKETALFLFILVLSVTTITAVVIWRNPGKIIPIDDKKNPSKEEENESSPVEFDPDFTGVVDKLRIVNRLIWLAQPASGPLDPLNTPVSLVIIQHTATESCVSQAACIFQTRHIQTFHMESNHWNDIGYNFLIGGDGAVYEGRGWKSEGAHTLGWNTISIGVAFIGTYNTEVPPDNMINALFKLIEKGIELGYLSKNYKIMGARQFSGTESPGKAFFDLIKTWTQYGRLINGKIV